MAGLPYSRGAIAGARAAPVRQPCQYGGIAVAGDLRANEADPVNQARAGWHAKRRTEMDLYVIRRCSNWANTAELEAAAAKSSAEGEKMSDEVRWIRSYVVEEADGRLGTVCIYQGVSPEAIRRHAENTGMSADEIVKVADTVIVRDDPVAEAAAV
jgi:Protein of unknown function (DUF4242)